MINSWDQNANKRHNQILSGKDISLTRVLVPTLYKLVESLATNQREMVLEVGCGTGYLTKELSKCCNTLVAIEPSISSAKIAKTYISDTSNVEILELPIEDIEPSTIKPFDLVVSNMSFQAVNQLDFALRKIQQLLKTQGALIFSIPHPVFWPLYKGLEKEPSYKYKLESSHQLPFTITNDREPLPAPVPYNHRPLEKYFSLLHSNGFSISNLLEPMPDDLAQKELDEPWVFPHFLVISCEKKAQLN